MSKIYKKKYVRFKWWQYRGWFVVIIILTFCLGGMTGYFMHNLLDLLSSVNNTAVLQHSGVEPNIGAAQPYLDSTQSKPEPGKQQDKDH